MIRQTAFHSRRRQASARVQLVDRTVTKNSTIGGPQPTALWTLASSGIVQYSAPVSGTTNGETWLLSGLNSDYEVRFTDSGGDLTVTGVTFGSWLACSTTRTIQMTPPTEDNIDYGHTVFVEIRDKTTLAVLCSATINLSSTWS